LPDPVVAFGRFELVPSRRQLLVNGQPVAIGARAFDLLHALVERRERTVSKNELLDLVWPDVAVEEANLPVQISALRKLLGAAAIATVPGRGYRFVAPTHQDSAVPRSPVAARPLLPAHGPPPIGRDDALRVLAELVRSHTLVTLTGPGGIGKTRLALAAAHTLSQAWPDGAAWVELADVLTDAQVAPAVAQALQLDFPGPPGGVQLAGALKGRAMLLVLDNGEHVLQAVIEVVKALRSTATLVHVLLTSQETLRIPGEQVFSVPPLDLPALGEPANETFGAIRLFVERARAADRRFVLDASNASAVAEVCRRLDGLPLAIELAAARVPLLGARGLRDRLAHQFDLLTRGARDAMPRHQTLRGTLAWSYSLLDDAEQTVLRRVGVFVGGFTLELAQAVAGDEAMDGWSVLEALGGLIDKSLVSVDSGEPVRYRLLETMRAFALERLAEVGEIPAIEERHARAVAALFERVDESRFGDAGTAGAAEVTRLLLPEIDNARAALAWSLRTNAGSLTAQLAGSGAAVFHAAGLVHEILPLLRASLPHLSQAPPSAQVNVLLRLGGLGLFGAVPHDELQKLKLDAVTVARRHGLRRRLQISLAALGFTLARRGDVPAASEVVAELEAIERSDDPAYVRVLALSISMMLAQHRDDIQAVVDVLGQQRTLLLGAPDEVVGLRTVESNLILYLNVLGRYAEAARLGLTVLARPELPRSFVLVPCATAYALASLGRIDEARRVVAERRRDIAASPITAFSGEALAMLCLAGQRLDDAVRIDAAIQQRAAANSGPDHPLTRAFRAHLAEAVETSGIPPADVERWRREGTLLNDAAAVNLALR